MRKHRFVALLIAIGVIFAFGVAAFAGGSHPVKGYILPSETNYTPADYKMWISTDATKTNQGACSYNNTLKKTQYVDNIGNFYNGWTNGQVLIAKIEKSNAAETGAGFYGVSSLILSDATPSQNFPDIAVLANIPQPTVTVNNATGRVDLSWSAASGPAGAIAGYNVYRLDSNNNSTKLNGNPVNAISYSDNSGVTGTLYTYAVKIVFTGGVESAHRSLKSNQITFPAGIPSITISPASVEAGWGTAPNPPVNMTINGTNTNFVQGTTTVTFEPMTGITIVGTPAVSGQQITLQFRVDQSAPTGNRTVRVKTGAEEVTGTLLINPAAPQTQTLSLTTPTAGQTLTVGQKFSISWNANSVDNIKIEYSTNEGSTWTQITAETPASAGWYQWTVPNAPTVQAKIRISDAADGSPESTSPNFTIQVPTSPTLVSATPNSGTQGDTISSVAIVGVNTHFKLNAPTVNFGDGITHGAVVAVDNEHLTVADVVISADAARGARNVVVTAGPETASGQIFTVNEKQTPPPTSEVNSVVLDDFEGTLVIPGLGNGYYNQMGNAVSDYPTPTRIDTEKHEGTYSMKTTYPATSAGWRGWGAIENSPKNISQMDNITFWMKGDGSSNKVKFQVKDYDGDNFAIGDADAIPLSSTVWQKYSIPISKISQRIANGSDQSANGTLNLNQISQYQFVFTGASASNGILIDYIVAEKTPTSEATDPVINSPSNNKYKKGDKITLTGANLGDGIGSSITFNLGNGETSILSYSTSGENRKITSWSADKIEFTLPDSISLGDKELWVTRADKKDSNHITITVVASAATSEAGASYNYPNPFNPLRGDKTKIVFNPQSAASANIYIFDSSAKVVSKIAWAAGQSTEVEWDGKNAFSEILGDGAYPYRVVDASGKVLGKGKILIINK